MIRVLHIIQSLSLGGATRALIATAKYSTRAGGFRHSAVSLLPAAPEALNLAAEANVEVFNAPDRQSVLRMMGEADIVHVNFWNNPEVYEFLRSELPPVRLLLWYHIAGDGRPQIITRQLVYFADFNIATNPFTLYDLPVFREMAADKKTQYAGMVYDAADFERVSGIQKRKHAFFNVGYIGTVHFTKMHPRYVAMSSAVRVPEARFIVCGGGIEHQLSHQAQELGEAHRFDFRGYVQDIRPVIEILDVCGYPLCENTYGSSELNLQEVMVCGVPPVVFPYGGIKQLVVNDYTGMVVRTEKEYSEAVEYLYHDPAERERIGRNAREYALQIFGAENVAKKLQPVYRRMMEQPKRSRSWGLAPEGTAAQQAFPIDIPTGRKKEQSGAQKFVESLGETAEEFAVSLNGANEAEILEAEAKIANAAPILCHEYGGGILHYKNCYPNDPHLRLWAGLVRLQQGHPAESSIELRESLRLGLRHWRVSWYLAQAAEQVKDLNAALEHLQEVTRAAPRFQPARNLLKRIECLTPWASDLNRDETHADEVLASSDASVRPPVPVEPCDAGNLQRQILRAFEFFERRDFENALDCFDLALREEPRRQGLNFLRARCLAGLLRVEEARQAAVAELSATPNHPDALKLIAELDGRSLHAPKVSQHSGERIETASLPSALSDGHTRTQARALALCHEGAALLESGQTEAALAKFEQALPMEKGLLGVHYARALCLEKGGNLTGALEATKSELLRQPGHTEAKKLYHRLRCRHRAELSVRNFLPDKGAPHRPSLPKITVVTPSFNQAAFLEDCINSVLGQNYPNLEYIIIDGGSTDGSVAIIRKYAKYLAHWQSEPDGGQYAAIQQGFRSSSGALMTWLNSDDRFHPFAFEIVAAAFLKRPEVSWIMGRPNSITSTGQPKSFSSPLPRWSRQLYLEFKYRNPFIQQEGTFWRRTLWERAGARLRTEMKLAGDLELWTRFFRHAQLYTLDALVGSFRSQPNQKTHSLLQQYFEEAEGVLREEVAQFQLSNDKTLMPAPDPISVDSLGLGVQLREMSSMNTAKFFLACGNSELAGAAPDLDLTGEGMQLLQGQTLFETVQPRQAEGAFRAKLKRQPKHADALPVLAEIIQTQTAQANRMPASYLQDQALESCHQGAALLETFRYSQALEKFNEALKIEERVAGAQYARALCLEKIGRYAEAAEALRTELRLQPNHAEARKLLRELRATKKQPKHSTSLISAGSRMNNSEPLLSRNPGVMHGTAVLPQGVFKESQLAHQLPDGLKGLEIGPSSHNPFGLNTRNVGQRDEIYELEQLRLMGKVTFLDFVARADEIPVESESEDFILSSHVVEHCPNLVKTLLEWFRIVKPGGYIYMIVPHRDAAPSDVGRPLTDWKHLLDDYLANRTPETEPEAGKFLHCHYHVFVTETMKQFMQNIFGERVMLVASQDIDDKVGNGFALVYRKAASLSSSYPWTVGNHPNPVVVPRLRRPEEGGHRLPQGSGITPISDPGSEFTKRNERKDHHFGAPAASAQQLALQGFQRFEKQDWRSALGCFEQALKVEPQRQGINFLRAQCLSRLGQWKDAERAVFAELKIQPNHPDTRGLLRELRQQQKVTV